MCISKELLSEVLGLSVLSFLRYKNGEVYYLFDESCGNLVSREGKINIHELAHMCKEWALKNSRFTSISSGITKNETGYCILENMNRSPQQFYRDTEPEAIFKACQWVLNNKD